jgi:hypothetical protein
MGMARARLHTSRLSANSVALRQVFDGVPFNQADGKVQALAQSLFLARHGTVIVLVIVAGQVHETVKR